MTLFLRTLNFIKNADISSIENVRYAAIVLGVFVFGITLRSAMFSPDAQVNALATAQPEAARVVASVVHDQDPVLTMEDVNARDISTEESDAEMGADADPGETKIVESAAITISDEEKEVSPLPVKSISLPGDPVLFADAYIAARGTMPVETKYEYNSRKKRAPASLTKLMTAVIVAEQIPNDEAVTITERAVATEGIAGRMRGGERFAAEDLMKMMLIVSSNDAAEAFADYFIEKGDDLVARMNEKAREIGMNDTHFANASGLDADGHYSTAFDLALLASYSLRHEAVWDALSEKSDTVYSIDEKTPHQLLSNNPITQKGMNGVKGSKTGFTENALGCMITALDDGAVVVVLGSKDRARDTEQLIRLMSVQ